MSDPEGRGMIRIRISFTTEEELDRIKRILSGKLRIFRIRYTQGTPYKKAYIDADFQRERET